MSSGLSQCIRNATFNNVHGNQHNHTYYIQNQNQFVPISAGREEWMLKMYQEYDRFPTGKIRIIRTLAVNRVCRRDYEDDPDRLDLAERYDGSRANRVSHLACLVEGREESSPFLCVGYTGLDAQKIFKRDCLTFSCIKHANVMQLRGFNDSDSPILLFHEELLPVHFILQHHRESSLPLQCYFSLQARNAMSSIHDYGLDPIMDQGFLSDQMVWIQPSSGRTLIGTKGPPPVKNHFPMWPWHDVKFSDIPVVSMSMYNNSHLFKYLLCFSSDHIFLDCLAGMHNTGLYTVSQGPIHPSPWYHISGQLSGSIIASFQPQLRWLHIPWSSDLEDCEANIEDGSIGRTRVTMTSISHMQGITFQCWFDCRLDQTSYCRDRIWLSQAWSIFSMLNIPKDEWPDYSLADIIMLELKPLFSNHQGSKCDSIDPNKASNHLQSPCYLFLYPVPELSDGSPDINTWMSGKNLYYWSSDSDGKSVMPESQCVSLELPSFVPNVEYLTWNWNPDIYESIWAWQEAKGFDPTMTYFTCSLGYPIMDVISPNMDDHFKVLSEDASVPGNAYDNFDEEAMDIDVVPTPFSHSGMATDDPTAGVNDLIVPGMEVEDTT